MVWEPGAGVERSPGCHEEVEYGVRMRGVA